MSASSSTPPFKQGAKKQSFLQDLKASLLKPPSQTVPKLAEVQETTSEQDAKESPLPLDSCLPEPETKQKALSQPKLIKAVHAEFSKLDTAAELPSIGSAMHYIGMCKPCIFLHGKKGCENGSRCLHCHSCTARETKKRRKQMKQ